MHVMLEPLFLSVREVTGLLLTLHLLFSENSPVVISWTLGLDTEIDARGLKFIDKRWRVEPWY
jgi:hypothetical protein